MGNSATRAKSKKTLLGIKEIKILDPDENAVDIAWVEFTILYENGNVDTDTAELKKENGKWKFVTQ